MIKKEKIIMDLDVGVDDAMSLIMGMLDPKFDIKLITTIFGNVGLKQATKNTCWLVQNYGDKDYPIYMGAERGLNTPLHSATEVHGKTGLGKTIVAKNVTKKISNKPNYGAIEAMRDCINKYPNEITIVSVGPTTNVAKLLTTYPEVVSKIKRIVLMVGSLDGKGSVTPYSSFNAHCDPDAVNIIISHKVPIIISTKEMGTTAYFEDDLRNELKQYGRYGELIYHLCNGYKDSILEVGQYAVHDTCALYSILDTDFFTREKVDMTINVSNDEKRGQTKFVPNPNSHITVLKTVDKKKVLAYIANLIKKNAKK